MYLVLMFVYIFVFESPHFFPFESFVELEECKRPALLLMLDVCVHLVICGII